MQKAAHDDPVSAAPEFRFNQLANRFLPFYGRFPYEGPMRITVVDPRGAICPPGNFLYSRVPKAANTTICSALAANSGYRRWFSNPKDPKDFFLRPSYLTPRIASAIAQDYFKFTFVRDPYARTLSAFLDKIARPTPRAKPFLAWFKPVSPRAPEFSDFVQFLDEGGLNTDMHWAPQSNVLLLPVEEFDFIGKVENLDEDLGFVCEHLFGVQARPAARLGNATDAERKQDAHYSPVTRAIIARLYQKDFVGLGYKQ